MRHSNHRIVAGAILGALMLFAADAFAQSRRPAIEITPGRARAFRAAVQRFRDFAEPVRSTRSDDLRGAIGDALDFTGVLLPLDSAAYLGPEDSQPLTDRGRSDCGDWRASGADALVEGEIRSEGADLVIDFAVWDVARCRRMGRRTMRRVRSQAARLAKRVADQIVADFTGTPGCASTELAFISDRTGQREVYVMDSDGQGARAATVGAAIKSFPGWSPNGEAIIYTSYTRRGPPGLFLTSRGRARPGQLFQTLLPQAPKYRGVFNPTGDRLAMVASTEGASDIFTVRRNGTGLRRLTRGTSIEVSPTWSPNGEQIAFVSDRSGAPQVYVMDQDGDHLRRITYQGSYNTAPAWSPDGHWIAYETRARGQFDIWLVDPSGEITVPLITHERSDESPSWSPDGRKLAFSSKRRGRADIYTVDVNGENLRRLTENAGENLSPAWGPFPKGR